MNFTHLAAILSLAAAFVLADTHQCQHPNDAARLVSVDRMVCVRDSQGTRVQICSEQGMVIRPGSSYEKMEDGRLRYPGPGYADYCPEDQHCDDEYISTVGGVCRPGKF